MKGRKGDHKGSDLNEIGIFTFLTLVIFFVAIGFPTLINTSPTVGYEGFEWTPITSAYQKAYAEQQMIETLTFYNFNPFVSSAYFLVTTDIQENLPDFTKAYNNGIEIETGILEVERGIPEIDAREQFSPPEILQKTSEIIIQNFDVPVPRVEQGLLFMSVIPISYVEILIFDEETFPSIFPVAEAETIDITAFQIRVNTVQNSGETCGFDSVAFAGGLSTTIAGDDIVNRASSSESGCLFHVFTFTQMIPSELSDNVSDLQIRFRKTQGATNHFCIFREMDGLPTTAGGLVTVDQVQSNATSGSDWGFSSTCASGSASGDDVGISMDNTGDTAFKNRLSSGVLPDGTDIDDGYSVINTFSGYPSRAGVNRFFEMDTSYARITFDEIPTNSSSGLWQLKEHNQFVTGVANNFKFERIGNEFNLNSDNTVSEVGQGLVWKTFNATDLIGKDIRAVVDAQRTGTGLARVFIDVMDGKFDPSSTYSCPTGDDCIISSAMDFRPNILREDLGTGDNHRLGIMEVDIGSGLTSRTIEVDPRYSKGSEAEVTVFVGFKDNSTDGSVNMNITSIEISDIGFYEFDKPDVRFFEGVHTTAPTQHLAELDAGFASSNFTQVGITTLFEDDFTLDPASNGWSESFIPDIDATGDISTNGTDAVLEKTGGTAEVVVIMNRTISTVGFRDLVLKLDARQNNTTYENADNLAIKINSGLGNTTIFRDRAVLNCVFDDVGEGTSAGNTAGCQVNIKLEPVTFDNTGINILLQAEVNDLDDAYFFENFQLVSFSNGTEHLVENLGTLGKDQDAESWFDVAISGGGGVGTQGDFVINATGLIDEGAWQDGTGTGGDMDEIRLGNHNNRADWQFLHDVIGDNVTSVNFWINGDVDGDPNYPILGSSCMGSCTSPSDTAGIRLNTQGTQTRVDIRQWDGASHFVDTPVHSSIPADDGNWHMVSFIYDKGLSSNWARLCVDNSCTIDAGRSNEFVTDLQISDQPLAFGGTDFGAGGVENPFSVDEVAVWHGYNITDDLTTLYNSGSGSSASNIGSSFLKGYWKFDFPSATNFTSVPLPTPNSITGGTVVKSASLFLDWVHDGANTTGYRIYRTSTEPADLEVIYNTLGSEDFDEDLDSTTNVTVAHSGVSVFGDEIIAQFDILLMNDTGNPVTSGGLIGGALYTDATTSTTSNGTLAVSDITVPTQDLTAGLTPFTFKFRDTNLKNITTGFPTDIGVGVFANTSFTGDVSVGLCTSGCSGAGSGRTFDTSVGGGTWIEIGATFDVPINVTAVNQTKLFAPAIPLVNDTGSLDTNFTDTTTDGSTQLGETYFYRIVPLNGDVEGQTIVILNGTDNLSDFFVNVTDTASIVDVSTDVNNIDENGTAVWQLREHDDSGGFEPRIGFRAFNGVLESNTADSDTVHINSRHGSGYVFKVFNKTDVEGKDFKIRWEGFRFGSTSTINGRMEVLDGAYTRSNNTQFPDNAGRLAIGGGLLASANINGLPFALQNDTISANDIDYASSTQDQITFWIKILDLQSDTSGRLEIHLIQLGNDTAQGGNVTLYDFTDPIVGYADVDVPFDGDNGLVESTCTGECPPQPFVLPVFIPDQVTGLTAVLFNTTANKLSWDETTDADSYRIFRIENPAPDFTDTFTNDKGWEILDVSKQFVNTTSTTFHWEIGGFGSEDHALEGATLNVTDNSLLTVLDDAFSMRFKSDFSTLATTIAHQMYFGIKEFNATTTTHQIGGSCSGLECSENGASMALTTSDSFLLTRTTDDNGFGWQNLVFGTGGELDIINTTDTFFIELIRDPDDNLGDGAEYMRVRLYNDTSYSENHILVELYTAIGAGGLLPDMEHITFTPLGLVTSSVLVEMEIDDLEFFNNVTVIDQWSILVSDTGDTTVMFTDNTLQDGKQYSYIVAGINGTNFGANSTGAKVQSLDAQIFNQTETDLVTVLDTVEVETVFETNQTDTATVLDQVETILVSEKNLNDTATILDEFHHNTTKVIRNVEFGSGNNVTIFSDDFTVDPAGNGWTETLTPVSTATGNIALHSSLTEAILEKTGGGFAILLETNRTIDTTGFTDIQLNFTARQDDIGGVYEPFDFIKIEIDTGSGFVDLLEDRQQWNGTNDLVGEGTPFIVGGTEASTGFISLPSSADNNANLGIRLSTNPDDTTKDSFWTEFELIGIPSSSVTIFSDDFSVDPASNGWSETSSQFQVQAFPSTATGEIVPTTVQGTEATFRKTGLVAGIRLNIDRTIDTTGFSNIAFNLSAFQDSGGAYDALFGDPEPHNALRVEADFGSGYDLVFTDMQEWNGVEDTAGESAGSSIGGQLTNTATGLIALNSSANENPNLNIRISWTTATLPNDFFIDNFELVSTSSGGSGRFTGDLIEVSDEPTLIITKPLQDTATILEQVETIVMFENNQNDTANVLDQTQLNITGSNSDVVTIIDDETLDISKSESDLTNVNDDVIITPPTIPEGITTLTGNTVVNTCQLSWSAPITTSTINGYRILRQVGGVGGFLTLIGNTSNTLTSHTDTGLTNNILYEYDVRAGNRFGFATVASNIVDCMPTVGDVPTAPSPLIAVEETNGDVLLTWIEPTFGDPTGYRIDRRVGGGGFLIFVNDTGTTDLTFTDTTTTPATQFTYRVAGYNSFGLGAFSNEAPITTASPPVAPLLSGVQNGNQIDISWTQPASDNPINGYRIDKRINLGTFFTLIANTSNTDLNFTDTNVTKPNTYGYRLRAISSAGEGTVSNVVDIIFGSHVIVQVREQDGSSFKGGGIVEGVNSTFSQLVGLNVNSNAIFDNLDVGNFNYTFTDADSFILNKTFNFPAPSGNLTSIFTINALVFDVSCPSGVGGTDIRIKVNYTDAKDITEFPAEPVCDSSDKISWTTRWQGDPVNDTSTMIADFISPKFMANADQFLVSTEPTATSFNIPLNQIESVEYVVNATDVTISFDLFLGEAPPQGGGGDSGSQAPSAPASIPDPEVVFAQRLTGLSLLSRTHQFAQAGDIIEGSITVNWEGELNLIVKDIRVGDFNDIRFELPSFPLDQKITGIGEFAMSTADVPYTIILPPNECNVEIGLTQNCFDPILHTISVEFTFGLDDQNFEASTDIFVDGRPIPIDIVQLQIILLFIVLIASAVFGNFIRMRFKKGRNRQTKVKKKFKKKFDSS